MKVFAGVDHNTASEIAVKDMLRASRFLRRYGINSKKCAKGGQWADGKPKQKLYQTFADGGGDNRVLFTDSAYPASAIPEFSSINATAASLAHGDIPEMFAPEVVGFLKAEVCD